MAAIQAVFIRGHEERTQPKTHTVYKIEIQASVRSWHMWRRFSEFVDLHTELTKSTGAAPPAPLPPKRSFSLKRTFKDEEIVKERIQGLEAYLRAIIGSKDERWRDAYAFKEFLGVPIGKQGGGEAGMSTQFTSASWLDEHADLQGQIRDIRADISKRDALADRGDVAAAHSTNVQAKKRLAGVLNRTGTLGEGLKALAMAGLQEGEIQRRTDMVARLQDDCEKLTKMVVVARMSSRGADTGRGPASEADRAALLQPPSGGGQNSKPFTRVFGAAVKPVETEQTRSLDEQGLVQLQQTKMDEQDQHLSQLTTVLSRQRQLALAIHSEVEQQNELLDELNRDVDSFGNKLTSAKKQLNRLG